MAMLLPTHFLYAFLYYTDVGAVTFILASYLVGTPCLLTNLLNEEGLEVVALLRGKPPESILNAAAKVCG